MHEHLLEHLKCAHMCSYKCNCMRICRCISKGIHMCIWIVELSSTCSSSFAWGSKTQMHEQDADPLARIWSAGSFSRAPARALQAQLLIRCQNNGMGQRLWANISYELCAGSRELWDSSHELQINELLTTSDRPYKPEGMRSQLEAMSYRLRSTKHLKPRAKSYEL